MTEIVFKDNDAEYLKWIQANPIGYVLNSYLNFSSKYLPLHRANCRAITESAPGTFDNPFTGGQYIKICSNNRLCLENWIKSRGGKYFSKLCKKCNPMVAIDEIDSQIEFIKTEQATPADKIIHGEKIQFLYDRYIELVRTEVVELGVKPTEVRHLIGRLGEFYCALKLNGTLAHAPNQHGFDVVCENGRRVSVKTTAQKSGFIPISSKTIHLVDDLMIIQYVDGELSIVYYGGVKRAIELARYYEHVGNYELDISTAKKLMYCDQQKIVSTQHQKSSSSSPSINNSNGGNEKINSSPTNHAMFQSAMANYRGKILTTSEIFKIIVLAFPDFSEGSILPNDHAFGNKGACNCAGTAQRIFDRVEPGKYLVL